MLIPDPVALGAVVRKRRSALGMSQTQLATKVGTTRQWLSRFEQGTNDVSIAIVFAILGALDLEIQIADPQGTEVPTTNASAPAVAVPVAPAAPVPNPETETDRFALLRSRDALAGLRLPGWVPNARGSAQKPVAPAAPAQTVARAQAPKNQETPAASSDEQAVRASETAEPTQSEHQVVPMPVRPGPKASHRMDQDIARIKKSSLFKR